MSNIFEGMELDPTEVVDNDAGSEAPMPEDTGAETATPVPMSSEGEKYLIDLLVKAFAHSPDNNELKIIDTVSQEYREENPKQIADTIQKLLDGGDEEFEETLNKV